MSIRAFIRIICRQRWLRLGLRYKLLNLMPYEDFEFNISFFGLKYRGNLNEYIDRHTFYFGAYEREELSLMKKFIRQDSSVIDIGANSGHHSLFFSRCAKNVYSFEPYEKVFKKMQERIKENNIKNIKVYKYGIGSKNGMLTFYPPDNKNEGGGSFIKMQNKEGLNLEVINGDKVLREVKNIALIKIDVEGMELEVLKGLKQTIKKHKPVIFVEMLPESQKNLSIPTGYKAYVVDANRPFLFLFNKPGGSITPFIPNKETKNVLFVPNNII